jgi:TatA/E family protein of Tat protein translocase
MPQLGPAEVLVILVVALLVFGPKRLPEVGRQVGRGLRELRKLQDTVRDELNDVLHHDDEPPRYTSPPPAYGSETAPSTARQAPSRFRAASASAPALGAAPTSPPPTPAPASRPDVAVGRPAHAPSRFRAPGS